MTKVVDPMSISVESIDEGIQRLKMDPWNWSESDKIALVSQIRGINPALTGVPHPKQTREPERSPRHSLRVEGEELQALRDLHEESHILLLTPVLIPLGHHSAPPENMDPFEPLGRAMCAHHSSIVHVPYVSAMSFEDSTVYMPFIAKAGAIVIVVCEPENHLTAAEKDLSLKRQMNFAEVISKVFEERNDPDGYASDTLVLVQCASESHKLAPDDELFRNVVESQAYDDDMATELAHAIFRDEV